MPERPPPSIEPPPPMSTTSLPPDAQPGSARPAVAPPILASDILREEVAPRAPGRERIRLWLGVFALASVLSAAAAYLGVGPNTARVFEGCLAAAGIAALGAVLPIPYAARASLAVAAGMALLVLGALDRGPLAPLAEHGLLSAIATLLFVSALPASLLFRARYRAFKAARAILTAALIGSVPTLALAAMAVLDRTSPLPTRVANAVLAASILTGLFGYMGEETTGACAQWAALALVAFAARVAMGALGPAAEAYGPLGHAVAAGGALAAATLVAYGVFQLLATFLAEQARAVDVHKVAGQPSVPEMRVSHFPVRED